MLRVTIPESEIYDERTSSFIQFNETTLTMEHSLISLSKWEIVLVKFVLVVIENINGAREPEFVVFGIGNALVYGLHGSRER